ncbi:MAG: sugar transferase [Gloeocapsa sp. DLM2.Bin57]|nr:MAG: sugar transferase [Gloeocapsa sp. DLM2.Bin57]
MKGICTLANDRVYDQLIALLNSIEATMGKDFPICVYPYDDQITAISTVIAKRPQVQLYSDALVMAEWDNYIKAIWDIHPNARQRWLQAGSTGYHRLGTHHRYYAFDGPFSSFLYMDADTLLLSPVDSIFALLEQHNCIVYDFQYKDPSHVYQVDSPRLTSIFASNRLKKEIFCSGFYASKGNLFPPSQREWLFNQLQAGDIEILYPMAPDQTILNYLMMKSNYSIYNLALNLPTQVKTGNSVTSSHFVQKDMLLYDHGHPLTYLHYIGVPSQLFTRVCRGENLDFPYREIFLSYRYLYEPENKPKFQGKAKPYNQPPNLWQRISRKIGL